ncbi:MAG: type VI secretion system baseplate subunit TssF [Rhodospirillales bacterium]|nr:type VI secretion system baseplate subunit TssF [Rhodospirillales bacterium]
MDPRLLRLYESELDFVREMGGEFAREFPKIAARLNIGSFDVVDPYVERLLEGFALLTARIQLKMEAEFPTLTQSLLQMVYPHYLAPTPSMAVVQVTPTASLQSSAAGAVLPRNTELRSLLGTEDQTNCEFRTAHAVELLPIAITEAEYIGTAAALTALNLPDQRGVRAAIRLRLKATGEAPFAKIPLERLPLFLSGPPAARVRLYEQLVADLATIYVRPAARPTPWLERLPAEALRPVGFEPDESLLPRAAESFDGYRLLQEYYAMPERFLFVELGRLGPLAARCAGHELDIVLLLNRSEPALANAFGSDQFSLFCTPAINLFPKRGDRVNLTDREVEHHIVPDRMRPLDFEVFSVTAMEGYAADGSGAQTFMPFYATNDLSRNPDHRAYYTLRREPRQLSSIARQRGPRSSYFGHEAFVSLVDAEASPLSHQLRQLGPDLLCTNRDLPLAMPVGKQHTDFTVTVSAPVASVRCRVGPTTPRPCRGDGEYAWRFISHLGLNYLSLTDTDERQGAAALRELLRLYVPAANVTAQRQMEAVMSIACHPIVRRIPGAGPISVGRGLELSLTIDETPFGGAGAILLAGVLERFFAKYVSINAFTETVFKTPDRGEVKRWPIRIGQRPVL